jgi:hypothetical protein
MNQYAVVTKIDVGLDQTRNRYQKKNFESLVQILQIRTQIESLIVVKKTRGQEDIFKSSPKSPTWLLIFNVEQGEYFEQAFDSIIQDIDYVPCITGLEEGGQQPFFRTQGPEINTVLKKCQLIPLASE